MVEVFAIETTDNQKIILFNDMKQVDLKSLWPIIKKSVLRIVSLVELNQLKKIETKHVSSIVDKLLNNENVFDWPWNIINVS